MISFVKLKELQADYKYIEDEVVTFIERMALYKKQWFGANTKARF